MLKPCLKADAWKTDGQFLILCGRILCVWHRMKNRPNDLKTTSLEHFNSMKHIFPKGDFEHRGICFSSLTVGQRKYFPFSLISLKQQQQLKRATHIFLVVSFSYSWNNPKIYIAGLEEEHYWFHISGILMI